ncbi:hypothetical protein ABT288_16535 [Streptomyces sp. NPDC001093]|uniref:hypothetical protein n=1 Tax=Streptomyces sp. NPDC001093 TaxID=3154376 RepID=UPI003323AA39
MPTARGGIAAAAIGMTARGRRQLLAPMPVPRHGTATAAVDNMIHIPGGGTKGGGAPVDTHNAYRPHGRWPGHVPP